MPSVSPASYGLLGLLAARSWTGYELTQQVQRSLRFVWPTSEGHLYREQTKLVALGWATVEHEEVGRRTRKRYAITEAGRAALGEWLASAPDEPHFQIEGIAQAFFADRASPTQLAASMRATGAHARAMLGELCGYAAEYLDEGGPMTMLEEGLSGPGQERLEYRGRPMFPERLHVVALAMDAVTRLLQDLEAFCAAAEVEVGAWQTTTDPKLAASTRQRLEEVASRKPRPDPGFTS